MPDLFEVRLVDGASTWSVGWVVEQESDRLLDERGRVLLFDGRPALEHYAQEHGLRVEADLPDEVDLDLGGWLSAGFPEPTPAEVLELWQLLVDDPAAGRALADEQVEEAYDDLAEAEPGWFQNHGPLARRALADAVGRLRRASRQV